jgi:hypothetical protein
MVKPYVYKIGPDDDPADPMTYVESFWSFINTFNYTRRERDIAMGILSVMFLAIILLICAVRIGRNFE